MTVGLQHSLIICPRCRDTGLVLIGDGYSVDRCPAGLAGDGEAAADRRHLHALLEPR